MENYINILVRGKQVKYYPKGNKFGFYYELDGMGFYTKDLFGIWGRPTKSSAIEVAENYINSWDGRKNKFDEYKK